MPGFSYYKTVVSLMTRMESMVIVGRLMVLIQFSLLVVAWQHYYGKIQIYQLL